MSALTQFGNFLSLVLGTAKVTASVGSAAPEGSVSAPIGSVYFRTTAGSGTTLYVKELGSSNVGWSTAGIVKTARTTFTNAQIKALPAGTTANIIVPAPGTDKAVMPFMVTLQFSLAAGYTNIANYAYLAITHDFDGAWTTPVLIDDRTVSPDITYLSGYFGAAVDKVLHLPGGQFVYDQVEGATVGFPASSIPDKASIANKPLYLTLSNSAGNLTGGNASNSLKVNVCYAVEDLS